VASKAALLFYIWVLYSCNIWYDENAVPDKFLDALHTFPEDMRVLEPTEDYAITLS